MNMLQIAAVVVVLAAACGVLNYFFLRLPQAIGILAVSLIGSIALLLVDHFMPGLGLASGARDAVRSLSFSGSLLDGMLGLLLFAGALHVPVQDLRDEALPVALMATLGVAISTVTVGLGFSWITGMPILVALVFGAIVSPTDPVAVLGVLGAANIRKSLETKIAGESLFNDGVGYVVYLLFVGMAFPAFDDPGHATPKGDVSIGSALALFAQEALGGIALGAVLGWLIFQLMRRIDDWPLEVLITVALALGGYELAIGLHVSAPIMAVVSGLLIGEGGRRDAMSDRTRRYVEAFWNMIDEILNAALFVMIGVELFSLTLKDLTWAIPAAIVLSLVARLISVAVPLTLLRPFRHEGRDVLPMMTWGGLKGGISVALALSLPQSDWSPTILTATYAVVVFSILVQGLTVGPLARRLATRWTTAAGPVSGPETGTDAGTKAGTADKTAATAD